MSQTQLCPSSALDASLSLQVQETWPQLREQKGSFTRSSHSCPMPTSSLDPLMGTDFPLSPRKLYDQEPVLLFNLARVSQYDASEFSTSYCSDLENLVCLQSNPPQKTTADSRADVIVSPASVRWSCGTATPAHPRRCRHKTTTSPCSTTACSQQTNQARWLCLKKIKLN